MKNRIIPILLLILSIFAFAVIHGPSGDFHAVRIKAPEKNAPGSCYYYDARYNPFYPDLAPYKKTDKGYVTGNCTWYAWGRACEIAGKKLAPELTSDAGNWWYINVKNNFYPYGSTPKRGAIICYETHVGVVEQSAPLRISESGWTVSPKKGPIVFHCGTPWRKNEDPLGYIYVLD